MTKANELVARPLKGGQDQVGVPQVPLYGHGDALETGLLPCGIYLIYLVLGVKVGFASDIFGGVYQIYFREESS